MADRGKLEYHVYEVFAQRSHLEPHVYQYSLLASSPDMALAMAKENFLRRSPAVSIWVVRRDHIHATSYEDPDLFERTDKSYREPMGYRYLGDKWRRYRQEQLNEKTMV